MMNITFTTLMYGLAMPILFPLGALAIYMQRLCEKIHAAYIYKLPARMGEELAQEALGITKYAPLFLLFNGAWLMDNRKMFDN